MELLSFAFACEIGESHFNDKLLSRRWGVKVLKTTTDSDVGVGGYVALGQVRTSILIPLFAQ